MSSNNSSTKISAAIYAELTATCDALGYNSGDKFLLDQHAVETVKDLIRFLKKDDDTHSIRRYLGQSKLLQKDLLKIFVEHADKEELWNVLLRLLINLTSPALMLYNEELPTEKVTRNYYLQILGHLQEYKSAMANDKVWTVVKDKLANLLDIESSERNEDQETLIERILIFIRNVLRVPPSDLEKRTDNDTTEHDEVLFAFHTSGITDLLVYIASNKAEQEYHMQILEITSFMFCGQNPSKLATVQAQRSATEKLIETNKLNEIRKREQHEKMAKMKKYAGSRHSRFGGTFVVQNMKAIGDNEMICHKPYQKIEDLCFSVTKQKFKKRKNKTELMSLGEDRVSALSVRLFLKEFCVEFLNAAYNSVMRHARSCINAATGDRAANEASHYMWALKFFMNFNRHYKFEVKLVSETISTEVFYTVQRQIEHDYEMIRTDKKKAGFWSSRMHLGLNAYQELLLTLIQMDGSSETSVKNSSRVIMNNIFYVPEYRDTMLNQLLNYNEQIMSRQYLVDLVTTVHLFLKMLKNYCDKERHVVVAKVKRKKAKRKKKSGQKAAAESAAPEAIRWEDQWDEVGPELSAVMRENTIPEVMPFDATIETPVEEQKGDAMKKIQKLLRCRNFEQAIGLLRSAREVWPENDHFGRPELPVEEEYKILHEVYVADLGVPDEEFQLHVEPSTQNQEKNKEDEGEDEESSDDTDEEEEAAESRFEETHFDFMDFMRRFCNVRVVMNLTLLFQTFDKNTPELNHYVLKMYYRIAHDCKMPAMIYQASIFRVLQRVFASDKREHKDLAAFGRFVIRGFAQVAARNPKAYMELLFWKGTKQATEMTDGYDCEHGSDKKSKKNVWTDAEEDELRTLFMEHETQKIPRDLIEYIMENLINQDRTRRAVIKKLKELHLIVNSKGVRAEVAKRLPKEWSQDEIVHLTTLVEQMKNEDGSFESEDPLQDLHDGLIIKRPKNKIKEKLLQLGLVDDPKQLRKRRIKKSDGPKSSWETRSASESGSGSDSDSDASGTSDNGSDRRKKRKEKSKSKSKRRPTYVYTDAQLSGLLKDVIAKDMKEALVWLKENLEESLEDRDEEDVEGQALVPLSQEVAETLDSASFQRFMRAAGIEEPGPEESYWRIPVSLLPATIKRRVELIDAALRGEFMEEPVVASRRVESDDDDDVFERLRNYSNKQNEAAAAAEVAAGETPSTPQQQQSRENRSPSPSPERGNTPKTQTPASRRKKTPRSTKRSKKSTPASRTFGESSSSDDDGGSPNPSRNGKENRDSESDKENDVNSHRSGDEEQARSAAQKGQSKVKPVKTFLDSDTSDEDENVDTVAEKSSQAQGSNNKSKSIHDSDSDSEKMEIQNETKMMSQSTNEKSANTSRHRINLLSDSEEDEEVSQNVDDASTEAKRIRSDNSDSETPLQKKRRILDSDEDEEEGKSSMAISKKTALVLSDDED